jgi:hypothetical protein
MTNGTRATVGFASNNAVISTGQRATVGSAYTLDGVGNRTQVDLGEERGGVVQNYHFLEEQEGRC